MTRIRQKSLRTPPAFPGNGPILLSSTRTSEIAATRFSPTGFEHGLIAGMPQEEAHVVLFQLKDHPAHDFWIDGRYAPAEAAPRETLSIFDLAEEPTGRLTNPVDTLMFHVPQAALDEMTEDDGAPKITSLKAPEGWNTRDPVMDRLHVLVLEGLSDQTGNRLLNDHLMLGIGSHFAAVYGGMRERPRKLRGGLAPWQTSRAKEMIASHLSKEIPLKDIAAECELSLAHFSRAFKVSTGSTPHEWLQARRIDRAKYLIEQTSYALSEIAMHCGFADQSHMTRTFSRLVGMGPGAWRRFRRG